MPPEKKSLFEQWYRKRVKRFCEELLDSVVSIDARNLAPHFTDFLKTIDDKTGLSYQNLLCRAQADLLLNDSVGRINLFWNHLGKNKKPSSPVNLIYSDLSRRSLGIEINLDAGFGVIGRPSLAIQKDILFTFLSVQQAIVLADRENMTLATRAEIKALV